MRDPVVNHKIYEQLLEMILQLENAVSRSHLILLVGPSGNGKTSLLKRLAQSFSVPRLNVNLYLSEQLLQIPVARHPYEASRIVYGWIRNHSSHLILLDNLEILFAPYLMLDPLQLLKKMSRNHLLVVAWNGRWEEETLIYAQPDHPEYRLYKDVSVPIIRLH